MNESDWRNCTSALPMLEFISLPLGRREILHRSACFRRAWNLVPEECQAWTAVAERIVQMLAAALRELEQRVREQLAAKT